MIKIFYGAYRGKYTREKKLTKEFESLEDLADWIFGEMKQRYAHNSSAMRFPTSRYLTPIIFAPTANDVRYMIHKIEDEDGNVIFNDGTLIFSGGCLRQEKDVITKSVHDWCVACMRRRDREEEQMTKAQWRAFFDFCDNNAITLDVLRKTLILGGAMEKNETLDEFCIRVGINNYKEVKEYLEREVE